MKSDFALAFNQICSQYNLSRDVVLDAVRAALITAYRRDWSLNPEQNITADIDMESGDAHIYLEKEVVEDGAVENPVVQIAYSEARRLHSDVTLGERIMVDVTPSNFGRIAAQTAKQVIIQRLREAERENQYNRFSRQEGEIIIGTIQAVGPQGVTLHLERTEEALMPRHEQIPGERYRIHQKIRVYVLEVRRTPRGPRITVSRSHPAMLRRLLELEVPEVRKGLVEIKAIAREAGNRAKVAVASRQPGLDPVGACVGMRGIRIQTISRELNGERIDVVEWSDDPATFIANALSMDNVLSVVVDESGKGVRTAAVVVLDEQLSLAIGRAGQNARLAAKLTGWRIDIQGATEAAIWALEQVNRHPELLSGQTEIVAMVPKLAAIVAAHERNRYPYNDEEKRIIKAVVEAVRLAQIEARRREEEAESGKSTPPPPSTRESRRREQRQKAKASVPAEAYKAHISQLELPEKVYNHLTRSGLTSVGELMERMAMGDEALLILDGIGTKALKEIKRAIAASPFTFVEEAAEEEAAAEPAEAEVEAAAPAESAVEPETAPVQEAVVEPPAPVEIEETEVEEAIEPQEPAVEMEEAAAEAEEERGEVSIDQVFDAPGIAVQYVPDEEEEKLLVKKKSKKKKKKGKGRSRTIIYDEEAGETFVVRKRRRNKDPWAEYDDFDY